MIPTPSRAAIATLATLCALAGCTSRPPTRPAPVIPLLLLAPPAPVARHVRVAEPAIMRCPALDDIRRLRATRPKPLRDQPMPVSPAERVARTAAQLGLYEARAGWADQVEDALARCVRD